MLWGRIRFRRLILAPGADGCAGVVHELRQESFGLFDQTDDQDDCGEVVSESEPCGSGPAGASAFATVVVFRSKARPAMPAGASRRIAA